jgi:hypothetical protein
MTVHRIDRWNIEVGSPGRNVIVPVEASYDGGILSVFLDRVTNWSPSGQETLTAVDRAEIRREIERNYADSGVRLEFDPEH